MPFKCDQCGREFGTGQGLEQHKQDMHGAGKGKKRIAVIMAIIIAIVAVIGIGYYAATSVPAPAPRTVVGPVGSTHIHHDFKLYVNGIAVDFSQPKYQLRSRLVHFEDGDGFVIHTHATGMTLGYMLNTLGIQLTPDCIKIDGANHCNDGNKTVKMYVNGGPNNEFGDYLMKDLDKILVSYGNETDLTVQLE